MPRRIIAVLGYSDGRASGLHPICSARLARAVDLADDSDVVVLSGWRRRRSRRSEAELMREAWPHETERLVCDPHARTTAENAAQVARLAQDVGAGEVIVITSSWHAPRARLLFRAALRGSSTRVAVAAAEDGRPLRPLLGELVRWPLVPVQLAFARRNQATSISSRVSGGSG